MMIHHMKWLAAAIEMGVFTGTAFADVGGSSVIGTTEAAILTHGAVVLGIVGLGVVGWYLRKRA